MAAEAQAAFVEACREGDVSALRDALACPDVNVHADKEAGYRDACTRGHVGVVRELLALGGDRYVNVHVFREYGLWAACHSDHVDVVRELLALEGDRRVDVHADDDAAFRQACRRARFRAMLELLALEGDRRVTNPDVLAALSSAHPSFISDSLLPATQTLSTTSRQRASLLRSAVRLLATASEVESLVALEDASALTPHGSDAWLVAARRVLLAAMGEGRGVEGVRGVQWELSWGQRHAVVRARVALRGGGGGVQAAESPAI